MSTVIINVLLLLSVGLVQCEQECSLVIQSYSAYPQACNVASEGYLEINSQKVWKAGWCSPSPNHRGINTFLLDPTTCGAVDVRNFDTHGNPEAAADLVAYLEWIREGSVVNGITGDEPTARLGAAQRTLRAAGVNVGDVQHRGNFAFIVQKGYPEKTRVAKHSSVVPSIIRVTFRGSTTDYNLQIIPH